MKKFNCESSCKKTSQMKCSSFCTKEGTISEKTIKFGCERSVMAGEIDQSQDNFLNCNFWDLGIKEQCSVCELVCPENKNKKIKDIQIQKQNLQNLISSLGPMVALSGKSKEDLDKIANNINSSSLNNSNINEVLNITNYAKTILDGLVTGKQIDLAEFNKIKKHISEKYGNTKK